MARVYRQDQSTGLWTLIIPATAEGAGPMRRMRQIPEMAGKAFVKIYRFYSKNCLNTYVSAFEAKRNNRAIFCI